MFSDNKALRDKLNEFFNWPGAGEVFFNEKIPVRFSRPINYFFQDIQRALDETNQEDIQLLLICGHNLIYGKESVFPSVDWNSGDYTDYSNPRIVARKIQLIFKQPSPTFQRM